MQKNAEGVHVATKPLPDYRTRKGVFAANVYQQDELRGAKEVITALFAYRKAPVAQVAPPILSLGGRPEVFALRLGTHVGARESSL